MKFVLLVEGHSEKEVVKQLLKRWLDPKLEKSVDIKVVLLQGYARFLKEVVKRARMYLDGPQQAEIIAVVGLLDLHGPDYPDHVTSAEERHDWAVEHIEHKVGRKDFHMFFAVHEFEAWLLSDPHILPAEIQSAASRYSSQPEKVDFDKPPSRLLDRIYKDRLRRSYKKTTYGKELFGKLDPDVAAQKCPRLKAMLEELLRLAREAGL